jgi:iron complex transport system permease protein
LGGAAFAVSVGVAWLDLTSFEQYVWFSFVGAVAATVRCLPDRRCRRGGATPVRLTPAGVALGVRT